LRLLVTTSPWLAAGALLFLVGEAALPNLTIVLMGRVAGRIPGAVTDGLGSAAGHALLLAVGIAGACYALSLLRGPAEDALTTIVGARVNAGMQRRLVTAVCAPAGIGHLEDPKVLDKLTSARGELTSYRPADAPMTLVSQIGDRLSGLLACLVLASFRWWLGLAVLAAWLIARTQARKLVTARIDTFRRATQPLRLSWYYLGLVLRPQAAKEVRVFGLGDWLLDRHQTAWLDGLRPSWRGVRRINTRIAGSGVLVLAVYALGGATLGMAAYHGHVGVQTLAIMLPMLPASMNVGSITVTDFSLETMLRSLPDLDELSASLAPTDELADAGAAAAGLPKRAISFQHVGFRYPEGTADVLRDLDLELPAGRSTAIVGNNGAGKTTLVTLLARLRDPTAGRILVDGVPVTDLRVDQWQRQVAVVFQDFNRYPLPAWQNVSLDLTGAPPDQAALDAAAEKAGLTDTIAALPHGWNTVLSPRYPDGADLSGGQWQRVALARALYAVARGATVLVLDEPTAQLDVRAEAAFYDRFLDITAGVTSVIISHRFSTVRRADRIAVLDDGRVSELGSHDELLALDGEYARLFKLQVARFAKSTPAPDADGHARTGERTR
jgi:ATP-binding cassette subfamily B protein